MKLLPKLGSPKVEITISSRTVIRVLLLVVATMIGLSALRQAAHALTLIFIAFFLALAFNPPVHWIAQHIPGKKRGSRSLGTALSFILILAILGAFLASIVPPIVRQTSNFISSAPTLVTDLQDNNTSIGRFVDRYNLEPQIQTATNDLSGRLKGLTGTVFSTLSQVGSSLISALTVLVLTIMMLTEGPHWIGWAKRLMSPDKRQHAEALLGRMYKVVKGYVNGQVFMAALASLALVPMLFVVRAPYPFALLFIVFVCGLIPMIGNTIGAIVVTLAALTVSLPSALIILGYYLLYQQIENYVLQPRIQANSTQMSPLLVFLAVVIGINFSGLLGGLVAIPIMGCIRVAVLYWLEHRDAAHTHTA